ncbi:MAG: LAGLIDADG endonuclease [Patescibacteria group bacterium]
MLIGSLLGDGTLRRGIRAINVNFKVEHGLRQKEYVFWKYLVFRNWVFTEPKLSYRYRDNGKRYLKSWWFRTVRHPVLTKYWKHFYSGRKKIIPDLIDKLFDSLVLAVWVMDDGCYQHGRIDISTYAFTLKEIHRLQDALRTVFALESHYFKDREKGYRIYFSVSETKKVINFIRPYIIPSMQYKIGLSQQPRND